MKQHVSRTTLVAALVLFVLSLPLTAYLLRSNNVKVHELQAVVVELDESSNGDIEQIEPALIEMAEYSLNHMNADISVTLENRYVVYTESLLKNQEEEASEYRAKVFSDAQRKCAGLPVSGTAKIDCVQSYISSQPGVSAPELPPVDLFFYEYASPTWSPDAAGISTLISVVLGLLLALIWIADYGIPMIVNTVRNDPLE